MSRPRVEEPPPPRWVLLSARRGLSSVWLPRPVRRLVRQWAPRRLWVARSAPQPSAWCRRPGEPTPSAGRGAGVRGGQDARRYPTRRAMRRVILLGVATLVASLAVWHPARVAVQALLLLPALFPSAPFEPLSLLTAAPSREQAEDRHAAW